MKRFMNIKKLVSILLLLIALSMVLASCNFSGMGTPAGGEESGGETPEGQPETPETPPAEDALTYEEYINMTADEQEAFIYSFEDISDFFLWHTEAKAKYDEEHKVPEIDGDIDLGDLLRPGE